MESTVLVGLVAARSIKWLKHVDPAIAAAATAIICVLALMMAARCAWFFISQSHRSSIEEKTGAVLHGIGYMFLAGLCAFVSIASLAKAESDPDSLGYASPNGLEPGERYLTPDDFKPGRTPYATSRFDPEGSPFSSAPLHGQISQEEMEREMRESFDVRRPKRNIEEDIPSELPRSSRSDLQSNDDSDSFDVRLPPSRSARKPEVALPATAELALPQFQYSLDQAQKSNFVGLNSGQDFRSHGPSGSVLVGLRIGLSNDQISGFEPIYQLSKEYVVGSACGNLGDRREVLLAKPGYVVGGVLVAADADRLALQLRFVKYDAEQGELNSFDQYDSERVGRSTGKVIELDGKGAMVVGIFGKAKESGICGLGVAGLKPATEASATTADSNSNPNGTSNGTVFRVWFSRDRKFSIEAKFLEIKNGKAVLEKRDGTTIEVDPAGLCDEDGKYIQSR